LPTKSNQYQTLQQRIGFQNHQSTPVERGSEVTNSGSYLLSSERRPEWPEIASPPLPEYGSGLPVVVARLHHHHSLTVASERKKKEENEQRRPGLASRRRHLRRNPNRGNAPPSPPLHGPSPASSCTQHHRSELRATLDHHPRLDRAKTLNPVGFTRLLGGFRVRIRRSQRRKK
jgi:hypothetical protein